MAEIPRYEVRRLVTMLVVYVLCVVHGSTEVWFHRRAWIYRVVQEDTFFVYSRLH